MHSLTFQFVGSASDPRGSVMLDDVRLETQEASLRLVNCGQPWESQTMNTAMVEETPSGAVAVDPGTNIWGGGNFVFRTSKARIIGTNDPFGCFIHFAEIESSLDDESWAGWGVNLNGLNVTKYGTLAFKVKRVNGKERPHIYLSDDNNRQYVDLDTYVKPSMDWQVVEIPLSDFSGVNLSKLRSLSLGFEWQRMNGALYIRDISFTTAGPSKGEGPVGSQ
jgi:hypothetical protein